ncbi:MAG TPA: ketosteroid isomerase-related protein [Geminicoccaceae bacterium]|nr:ketosteroid isomerase-related protein [Geminicoccaceae bacterium]
MREETIELIASYYAAFNRGDSQAMAALLAKDVVHDVNQGPREVGRHDFARFMLRMNRCYAEQVRDLVVMANEDGSRAAAEFIVDGTYLATDEGLPEARGQTYSLPGGAFFEVEHDRITRVTNYYNLEDWLAQVKG